MSRRVIFGGEEYYVVARGRALIEKSGKKHPVVWIEPVECKGSGKITLKEVLFEDCVPLPSEFQSWLSNGISDLPFLE